MNIVKRHVYRLEFNTWEPFENVVQTEVDDLVDRLKCRHILGHAGSLRLSKISEEIVCQEKPED